MSVIFMEVFSMDWRKNEGYIITNAITIGDSEIVLGVHETHPNMFVTWECNNKNDYYWGHYYTDLVTAQKDFCKRGFDKARLYENKTFATEKPKKPKEKEAER